MPDDRKKTTVNNDEYIPPKGAIGFAPELITNILNGEKLTTYRFGNKYDYLKVGDVVEAQDSTTGEAACKVVITKMSKLIFEDLPLIINAYETYDNKEQQRDVISGYYAFRGKSIQDKDEFIKFEFELLAQST